MQKRIRDWTLGEIQEYCKSNAGSTSCGSPECPFQKICDTLTDTCKDGANVVPGDWDLTDPPRWTTTDVEDARAIKRVFVWANNVNRCRDCILVSGMGNQRCCDVALLPSLPLGKVVTLAEIMKEDDNGTTDV